jgi:cell division protein FtsQ
MAAALVLGGWAAVIGPQHARPVLQRLFEVRQVTVEGVRHVREQEVLDRLALPRGIALHEIATAGAERRVEAHPWVKEATVTRMPFHELHVSIVERKAAAVIHTEPENLLADEEGRLLASLGPGDDHTLPVLTSVDLEGFFHGDPAVRQAIASGVELARLVGNSLEGRLSIDMRNPSNLVASVRGVQFQFGAADVEEQWERFQRVKPAIKTLRLDGRGRGANEVDLRYDNRVIVRERG